MTNFQHDLGTGTVGDDGVLVFSMKMPGKVNKLDRTFGEGLAALIDHVEARNDLEGLVITSGHRDFCAGADLEWVYAVKEPAEVFALGWALHTQLRRLEKLKVPVAAAMPGNVLGGGYELALACHHRVQVAGRGRVGLPEVQLGVFPGGGGTQRLPRLVGIQAALDIILQGKTLRPEKALGAGLVDAVTDSLDDAVDAARAWCVEHPGARQPWDADGFRWPDGMRPNSPNGRNLFLAASAMLYDKTAGAYRAPEAALSVVQEGASLAFDRALEVEARAFARIATGEQAKDMIRTLWFHRTAAERHEGLPSLPPGEDAGLQKVAILGAGMMGAGLAFVSAKAGYDVVLKDIDQAALDKGMDHVRAQAAKERGLDDDAKAALVARVTPTLHTGDLADTDLVIEAVVERQSVKHAVLSETQDQLSEQGIWASNTSALPITGLAEPAHHPDRFLGLHFFSPVEKMPLIEVIRGAKTSEATIARALDYAKRIRKTPILVHDGYGFFTSRTFAAYILEAVALLAEGHDPRVIEHAARAEGMVVPPLQVFDEVSLRLGLHVLAESKQHTGLSLPEVERILHAMVDDHGRIGRVGGAGFYAYENGKRRGLWSGLSELASGEVHTVDAHWIGRRLMLSQANETAKCIDAGVIRRYADAEVGAILGIGFAPNTGGPLAWLDRQGLPEVVEELNVMADTVGERFRPARILVQLAEKGERFFPA